MPKRFLGKTVFEAARERLDLIFSSFPKVYLSFSGGKDSGVLFHMAADSARKHGKTFGVLFIDLEAQYAHTIAHIRRMTQEYADCTRLYWVCLPLALRNAVSVYQPKWMCWDEDARDAWVRHPEPGAVTDQDALPFFERGMEFEDFTPKFGDWYSQGMPTACLVGIRAAESLNRFRAIANRKKETFLGKQWTTRLWKTTVYNAYPLYDWKTEDIWTYYGKEKRDYNRLYDLMHMAGLSIHQQRICQPYGDDQRKGLWLYHIIEPETWARIVARVSGVNSGAEFVQYNGNVSGQVKISKPDGHTWQSFCHMLLESMPPHMEEHYKNKIFVFLRWYEARGYKAIPDEADPRQEAKREVPSWRRIAKMLLRNDYWAKGLSFSQTKHGYFYDAYMRRIKKERECRRKTGLNAIL